MVNKSVSSGISALSIFVIVFFFLTFHPTHKSTIGWSDPMLFYYHPERYNVLRFDVDVNNGVINAAAVYHHQNEDGLLEYSSIYHLRQEPESDIQVSRLSQENSPSEWPSVFRDLSGKLHFFWGERRQDPNFELWPDNTPQSGISLSTDILHYIPDNDEYVEPTPVYSGNVGFDGRGSIVLPVRINEDSNDNLHVVFSADSVFDGGYTIKFPAYLKRNPDGQWQPSRFFTGGGHAPGIVSLEDERLITVFLGSDPNHLSINDVMAVYSNDGGNSWSDPELVFLSGDMPGWLLRIVRADGRVHLLWGQAVHSPDFAAPDAIWHCFTDDGGQTWTEPELIFQLSHASFRPPGAPAPDPTLLHIFYNYEILTDSYGQLHWVGCAIRLFESGQYENALYYSNWSPTTGKWEDFSQLDFGSNPGWLSLAYDNETNELYIFWADSLEPDQQALYYSRKTISVNITEPPRISPEQSLILYSNYPNPFSSTTIIPFALNIGGEIVFSVYDITGRKILSENLGVKPPGHHEHHFIFNDQNSGTYIYEISLNGKYRKQKNMIFFK